MAVLNTNVNASALRSYTDSAVAAHQSASDPHGDRAYADGIVSGLEPGVAPGTTAQYYRGDKSWQTLGKGVVGLADVDNTADVDKPVSTAQAEALALKAPLDSPAFTGTPTVPTAAPGTNTTQSASTAFVNAALVAEVTDRNAAIGEAVAGRDCYRGAYDASTNLFPDAGGSGLAGAVMMSDYWLVSVAGVLGGEDVNEGDIIHALSNGPGQTASLWYLDTARQVASNPTIEDEATTNDQDIVTPVKFWQGWAKGLTLSSFAASVRSILLTGYTIGTNAAIAATDTIMGALGNLQAQINNKANEKLTVTIVTATNYTATAANAGQSNLLLLNNAAAIAFTIPSNATLALPTGTAINCVQGGAGTVTFTSDAGVTLLSRGGALKTAGQYAFASAVKIGSDTWAITGDITL